MNLGSFKVSENNCFPLNELTIYAVVLFCPHFTCTAPVEYKLKTNETILFGWTDWDYYDWAMNGMVDGKWEAYV